MTETLAAKIAERPCLSHNRGSFSDILAPGTQLKVAAVATERNGLTTIKLEEFADQRLVS